MKSRKLSLIVNSLVFFALVVTSLASPARAEPQVTFTVTANNDLVDVTPGDGVCETVAGSCTLRAAIMEANTHVGADTIIVPAATYFLIIPGIDEDLGATGDLDVTESLTITGAGSSTTIIDAVGLGDRVFHLPSTAESVTISGLTIQKGGLISSGAGIANHADLTLENVRLYLNDTGGYGGAIYSLSPLTLKNVTIDNNSAFSGGGGVYIAHALDAQDSNLFNNTTENEGAGLYAASNATVDLVSTNFMGNRADTHGGNIYSNSTLTMEECYVSGGVAGMIGGGIYQTNGAKATLTHVTMRENNAGNAGGIAVAEDASLTGNYLVFDSNTADWYGGGIYALGGDVSLYKSTVSNNGADGGGAIFISEISETKISASTIISNTATGYGGGVFNSGSTSLIHTTLNANRAENGGGMYNIGSLWIESSTLSGNSAKENGGGIYDGGGVYIAIYNATITSNLAGADIMSPSGEGGGVYAADDYVYFRNTILSGNHHRQLTTFVDDECRGVVQSGDYNLIGTLNDCGLAPAPHDLVGEDPLLGDLADNGGTTHTHALLEGSPAIDGGNPEGCLGIDDATLYFDQRGVKRPLDGDKDGTARCDIGAYELSSYTYVYLPYTVK
jgi:predicted outer membrane repeat protein